MKIIISLLLFTTFSLGIAQSQRQTIDSLYQVIADMPESKQTDNLLLLAKTYMSVNLDSSVAIYDKIYKESLSDGDKMVQGKSLIGLGNAFTNLSKQDSAMTYFEMAEKAIAEIDDYDLNTGLWMNRGILFFHKADYNGARKEFEKVLERALEEDNKEDISRCYNNIALCYNYIGDNERALEMHIESAKLAESIGDPMSLAKSYNNMGLVYFDLEDYEKSEEYMLKSLEIKKEQGADLSVVGSYLNLGNSLRKLGVKNKDSVKLRKAKQYYTSALELAEETGYPRGINIAYTNLALVETSLGNYDNGVSYGLEAVKLSVELESVVSEMTARINLADAYRLKKQFGPAEIEMDKGLSLARETSNKYIEKEGLLIYSKIKSDKGDYKNGLKYYEQYKTLEDSISSTEIKNKVNELETKYQVAEKERDLAESNANLAKSELKVKKRNNLIYGGLAFMVVLGLFGYLLFNQQKLRNRQLQKENELKTALAKIETQNKLQEQRLRISRDLHDNIGSQLTFVTSSVDNLKYGLKEDDTPLGEKLSRISEFTTQTIYELRDTIWAMNKNEITAEDLQSRIANFIEKAGMARDEIDFSFSVSEEISQHTTFTSLQGMNIYRIIQEAVNNSLKYAKASKIMVDLRKDGGDYKLGISDNGIGFNLKTNEAGNGLNNIKKRARDLGGEAVITSEEGKGTTITVTFSS